MTDFGNNPEYEKLRSDPLMEALRDRTIKIDVPVMTLPPLDDSDPFKGILAGFTPAKPKYNIVQNMLAKVRKRKFRSIDEPWEPQL